MKNTLHISFYQRFRVCNIIINIKKTNGAQRNFTVEAH
jgi:hypothetical protein